MGTYDLLKKDGVMRGGLARSPAADTPAMRLPPVAVAECDSTAASARSQAAQIIDEPRDIPKVGRVATPIDLQGATLAVMKQPG